MSIFKEYVKYCDDTDIKDCQMNIDNEDYGFYCDLEDTPLFMHKKNLAKIPKNSKNDKKFIPINYNQHINSSEKNEVDNMKHRLIVCFVVVVISTFYFTIFLF